MPLIKYIASNIKGIKKGSEELEILIDKDFEAMVNTMNEEAKKRKLLIVVISAKRESVHVEGAIVEPAKMGNHLVGEALDVNIIDIETKEYWNSKKLANPTGKVKDFIETCEAHGIRWGGRFKKKDSVHFDSGLNVYNPELYKIKYSEYFPITV